MKSSVFTSYGFTGNGDPRCASPMERRRCEIDHLVPRSIGGADDVRNLWPEPYYNGTWTATIKDKLEARAAADPRRERRGFAHAGRSLSDSRR
jgi:hypothetical protein